MNEKEWVENIKNILRENLRKNKKLIVETGVQLAYAYEITDYNLNWEPLATNTLKYETDLLIYEKDEKKKLIKPRIVIEAKIEINTHDAITYSNKSRAHKTIHPYLRYGIMLGNQNQSAIPRRLFRHGGDFDFMINFKSNQPNENEKNLLIKLIYNEIKYSKEIEEIIFNSRSPNRKKYKVLERKIDLQKF